MSEGRVLKVMTAIHANGQVSGHDVQAAIGASAPLGSAPQARRGLVVSEVVRRLRGDLEADVFVEEWWPDGLVQAEGDWVPIPAGAAATRWLTSEHVLKRPEYASGPERLKVVGSAYRRDDFTPEAFFRYWEDVHAPVSALVPGLGAYVVSEVLQRLSGDVEAHAFVEQWWPDEATLDATADSPELAVAWADVSNYAKTTGTFWLVRETVLQAPSYEAPGLLER